MPAEARISYRAASPAHSDEGDTARASPSGDGLARVRLWIADAYLRDYHGHYFNYANSLVEAAERAGIECHVLANTEFDRNVRSAMPVTGVFAPWPTTRTRGRVTAAIRVAIGAVLGSASFLRGLRTITHSSGRTREVVFTPDVDSSSILALPFWLRELTASAPVTLVVMLRESIFPPDRKYRSSFVQRLALRALERQSRTRDIRLVCDSEALAEEYRRITSVPVSVVPIPHTARAAAVARAPEHPRESKVVNFVSLGGARRTKGFELLTGAIELLARERKLSGLQFTVQTFSVSTDPVLRTTVERLRRLPREYVQLIEQQLSEERYFDLLRDADVVVIPYTAWLYRSATSGPFAEALAAAKPVIVTDRTWMSDQLGEFGAGCTFRDGDVEDLARCIRQAADEYHSLARAAAARQPAWVGFHNADRLLDALTRPRDCARDVSA